VYFAGCTLAVTLATRLASQGGKTLYDLAKNDATRAALKGQAVTTSAAPRISPAEAAALRQERIKAAAARLASPAEAPSSAPVPSVPTDVADFLTKLSLGAHGARLVGDHRIAFLADCRELEESDLVSCGLTKIEARRFVNAAKLLGGVSKRFSAPVAAAPAAPAAPRVRVRALCVGVNSYPTPLPSLRNAVHDAEAVHAALSKLPGAESTLLKDCTKAQLEAALKAFRAGPGARGMAVVPATKQQPERTLGLFFFAGHGLQVNGVNHLVPSDFQVPEAHPKLDVVLQDTEEACVSLDKVMSAVENAPDVYASSILLDCCRNVPDFLPGMHRSIGGGKMRGGMGNVSAPTAQPGADDGGMIISFATAPGSFAKDASTRMADHSPFTAALLQALEMPRQLKDLTPFLRDSVLADTGREQTPWIGGSLGVEAGNLVLG
jgi:uncharacterized caspase-like protein